MPVKKIEVRTFANEVALDKLPDIVSEIAKIIGISNCVHLVVGLGGTDLPIPTSTKDSQGSEDIISIIGIDATELLIAHYAGERLYIPRCHSALLTVRNGEFFRELSEAIQSGMTQSRAIRLYALKYGFTERWAYELLKAEKLNNEQILLF